MTEKKLQKNSILNKYDIDGDNTITNEELKQAKEINQTENLRIETQEKTEKEGKFYYFLGFVVLILCFWGFWELCVYIWSNYAKIVVGTITAILVIISGTVFFAGSKILGVIFFIGTAYIYGFLDDLVPQAVINENKKIEVVKKLNNKSIKPSQVKICPSSGYKDNCRGIMTYKVGTYEGFFKNNKRHGQGTFTWKYGDKYVGQWKDDKENGQGSYYFKDGRKYVGQWKNGIKHGQGTFTWKDGDKYTGQWLKGLEHGQGTKTKKNGNIEKGIWKYGNFISSKPKTSSLNKQIKAKDTLKTSQVKICPSSGYKDNCKGKITYSGGNTYNGFFKNNKRHGKGTYLWKDGDKYIGTYYNDDPSYGTYEFSGKWTGDKYIGNFKNWKMHGQGSYYFKDGRKYVGEWKNDNKHGQGTYTWTNGDKYVGQWKDGKENGQGIKTFKNGKIEKGIWENGKFQYAEGSKNP